MRKLGEWGTLDVISSEVLSILQLHAIDGPLFSNLGLLRLRLATGQFIPFVSLFLSPRTTVIDIAFSRSDHPKAIVASMVTTIPTLCPNLQDITLQLLPRDPTIVASVSRMFLASNRSALRCLRVDSLLTEEAREVIFNLPDLRELSVVIKRDTSLPLVALPNLTNLIIEYDHDSDWLQGFHRATLGKLVSVDFRPKSALIGNFLEAFETVALTTSIPETLSSFRFHTPHSWRPNYRSLLPFTHLKRLTLGAGGVLPGRQIESLLRVFKQSTHTLPTG